MVDAPSRVKSNPFALQDFRGDVEEVAALVQRAWSGNDQQHLLYTSDLLASYFAYPGFNRFLAPTLYNGNYPLAFIAGFPRTVRYKGRDLRILICSFLSVDAEHKKEGYGVVVWSELAKRARAAGFDGMMNYCVDGEAMNDIILGCCRMLKMPTARLFTVRYQIRILLPSDAARAQHTGGQTRCGVVQDFLRTAQNISDGAPLARIWTPAEAEWQCNRYGAIVATRGSGENCGLVTGYVMEIANPERTKCLLIEELLWGTLDAQQRRALLQDLLRQAAQAGAQMAIVPSLNYADMEPLRAARFRSSARVLHAYLTVFSGDPQPQEVPSMYLDLF